MLGRDLYVNSTVLCNLEAFKKLLNETQTSNHDINEALRRAMHLFPKSKETVKFLLNQDAWKINRTVAIATAISYENKQLLALVLESSKDISDAEYLKLRLKSDGLGRFLSKDFKQFASLFVREDKLAKFIRERLCTEVF